MKYLNLKKSIILNCVYSVSDVVNEFQKYIKKKDENNL